MLHDETLQMHELVIRGGTVVDGTGAAPRVADIAIDDGVITAIGDVADGGTTEIDASGALVTPGWVDVHTHYDGQVSWDPELAPSSHHGVTTVIMGNCGVGFAPVKPGSEGFLIELMEGVEDIPGTALHEGIDWTWETYGEYLDALEAMPRTIDVGGQLPHAAVRAYVLGDRAHEYDVTPDEIDEMAQITRDALDAGAFGFSTSRTFLHTSKHGLVPGTHSTPDEVIAIAEAVRDSGHGLFQYVSDDLGQGGDEDWRQRFTALLEEKSRALLDHTRLKVPPPVLVRDGGARALWMNFGATCLALRRPPSHLAAFIRAEGGLGEVSLAGLDDISEAGTGSCGDLAMGKLQLRLHTRARALMDKVCKLLRKYCVEFVSCKQCRSAQTSATSCSAGCQRTNEPSGFSSLLNASQGRAGTVL